MQNLKEQKQIIFITSEQNIMIYDYSEGIHNLKEVESIIGYNDEIIDLKFISKPKKKKIKNNDQEMVLVTNSSLIKSFFFEFNFIFYYKFLNFFKFIIFENLI